MLLFKRRLIMSRKGLSASGSLDMRRVKDEKTELLGIQAVRARAKR
jgi:hypothetical protein